MPWVYSLFTLTSLHKGHDYMALQWTAGLTVMALFFCRFIYKKTSLIAASTLFYFLISALYVFGYFVNRNELIMDINAKLPASGTYTGAQEMSFYFSSRALFCFSSLILFSFFAVSLKKKNKEKIKDLIAAFGVANALYVLSGTIMGTGRLGNGVGDSGFLDYAGMNGVLIALSTPFLIKKDWRYLTGFLLCVLAIIASKSSIPYGVLAISLASLFYASFPDARKCLYLFFLLPFAILIFRDPTHALDSAYRFTAYGVFMGVWLERFSLLFGTGLGSFQVISPLIQMKAHFMTDVNADHQNFIWLWMHSDFFQSIFEGGMVSLTLMVLLFTDVLARLYKKRETQVFSLACGVLSSSLFDYPVRYFSTAFLCMYVIAMAYT